MVKVKFFNLIRSKYNIDEIDVKSGTLNEIIRDILKQYQEIDENDLKNAVIFLNQKQVMHKDRFNEMVFDNDTLIFTHFVGGG